MKNGTEGKCSLIKNLRQFDVTGKCLVQCIVGQFWLVEVGDSIFASNVEQAKKKSLWVTPSLHLQVAGKAILISLAFGLESNQTLETIGNLYLGISLVTCCWSCIWFMIDICNGCKGNKSTVPRDCSWPASISQSNCQKLVEFMRLLPQCSGMESHWMLCKNKPCTNTNRKIQCSSALGIWNQMGSNRNTAHHPSLPSHKVMSDRVCSTKRPYMVTCGHTSNWHLETSC